MFKYVDSRVEISLFCEEALKRSNVSTEEIAKKAGTLVRIGDKVLIKALDYKTFGDDIEIWLRLIEIDKYGRKIGHYIRRIYSTTTFTREGMPMII